MKMFVQGGKRRSRGGEWKDLGKGECEMWYCGHVTSPTTNVEKRTAEQETDGDGIFEFSVFLFFERNDDFITTLWYLELCMNYYCMCGCIPLALLIIDFTHLISMHTHIDRLILEHN